jgi:hypothetical protein
MERRDPEELMTVDHLVFGAPDVGAAIDMLEAKLGVRAGMGGKHPGAGTHNALLSLGGGSYLEIIGPDPEQEPPTDRPMPFGVDKLAAPRLVTWAAKARADFAEQVAKSRRAGWNPGDPQPMSRKTPDGTELKWTLTRAPEPIGDGLVPFLIDWGNTPHPSDNAPGGCELVRLRAEHPDPHAVRDALLALDVDDLTLIPGPEPLLVAIIRTPSGEEVELR